MMSTKEENRIKYKLKNLGMHESLAVGSECEVMRVPNGFIYTTKTRSGSGGLGGSISKSVATTFVPFRDRLDEGF